MKKIIIFTAVVGLIIGLGGGIIGGKYIIKSEEKKLVVNSTKTEPENLEETAFIETMKTLRGKTDKEFDKEFITQMMNNSQNAIEMTNLAKEKSERAEIKKFSEYINKTEPVDINQLKNLVHRLGIS